MVRRSDASARPSRDAGGAALAGGARRMAATTPSGRRRRTHWARSLGHLQRARVSGVRAIGGPNAPSDSCIQKVVGSSPILRSPGTPRRSGKLRRPCPQASWTSASSSRCTTRPTRWPAVLVSLADRDFDARYEVIIADDASTDASLAVARDFAADLRPWSASRPDGGDPPPRGTRGLPARAPYPRLLRRRRHRPSRIAAPAMRRDPHPPAGPRRSAPSQR
jgi:hypothetical protein